MVKVTTSPFLIDDSGGGACDMTCPSGTSGISFSTVLTSNP